MEGTPSLGRVEAGRDSEGALRIGDCLTLTHQPAATSGHGFAVMEWEAGARSDMISDAVVATLMQVHDSSLYHSPHLIQGLFSKILSQRKIDRAYFDSATRAC